MPVARWILRLAAAEIVATALSGNAGIDSLLIETNGSIVAIGGFLNPSTSVGSVAGPMLNCIPRFEERPRIDAFIRFARAEIHPPTCAGAVKSEEQIAKRRTNTLV